MPVLSSTYSQQERVDKEASIFSIGGYCAYNLISVDSEAFCSFFFSCDTLEERQWVSSKLRTLNLTNTEFTFEVWTHGSCKT